MSESFVIPLLVVGFINLLVAASVFLQPSANRIKYTFLFVTLATALWAWGIALFIISSTAAYAQQYLDVYYVAALIIATSINLFAHDIAGTQSKGSVIRSVIPILILVTALSVQPSWLIEVHNISPNLNDRITIHLVPYSVYAATFITMFAAGWWRITVAYRKQGERQSRSHSIISLGIAVAGVFGALFNLVLPWFGEYRLIALGPLFSVIFTASISYAIARYSLFDLRKTFMVTLGYILAGSTVAICYIALVLSLGDFISHSISRTGFVTALYVAFALLGVFSIDPLKKFFDRATARIFFRQYQSPEEVLEKFGDAILVDIDEQSIIAKTRQAVLESAHASFVEVIDMSGNALDRNDEQPSNRDFSDCVQCFDDLTAEISVVSVESMPQSDISPCMADSDIAVIARMQLRNEAVGYIIVGNKRGGNNYTATDLLLITTMADEAALAISNSQRFDEIQQFNARLEREVTSATRELKKSNKKLRELDATKDEFISMASHQLRTPLTSIKGYLSMVLEGDAGEVSSSQRKLLKEAYISSERMVHLISDFLNVSRLQTGKFMLESKLTNISKLVEEEVESMRQISSAHAVKILYKKPRMCPELYIDGPKIRQVVMNFIDNAVYYSPDGTPVSVELTVEDGDIVLRVNDSGIGVPKAVQKKLFTKFFRADNARRQRPDGTGVGLFLAKRVIDEHGGKLVFRSQENRGSTFGFRLPIKRLSTAPDETL